LASTLSAQALHADTERSLSLAVAAARSAEENRGQDVVVLDMRDQTAIFDFFVVATGTSQRQLRAMADAIDDVLQKDLGHRKLGGEGYQNTPWIVLDYGSIVVHLFDRTARDYYSIEDLWAGAKRVEWKQAG
jgi:ribosome-associated protein